LTLLDLRDNRVATLPSSLVRFLSPECDAGSVETTTQIPANRLHTVMLSGNPVRSIEWNTSAICELPGAVVKDVAATLQSMDLSLSLLNNPLPWEVGLLTNLTYLNMAQNLVSNFPESMDALTQLRAVVIESSQSTTVPDLQMFSHVECLDARANRDLVMTFDSSWANLRVLDLSKTGCHLHNYTRLREVAPRLTTLKTEDCLSQRGTDVSAALVQAVFEVPVTHLDLSATRPGWAVESLAAGVLPLQFTDFPANISLSSSLTELKLDHNRLGLLPP
jgi:internalin A